MPQQEICTMPNGRFQSTGCWFGWSTRAETFPPSLARGRGDIAVYTGREAERSDAYIVEGLETSTFGGDRHTAITTTMESDGGRLRVRRPDLGSLRGLDYCHCDLCCGSTSSYTVQCGNSSTNSGSCYTRRPVQYYSTRNPRRKVTEVVAR
jgi:hypothetical protein